MKDKVILSQYSLEELTATLTKKIVDKLKGKSSEVVLIDSKEVQTLLGISHTTLCKYRREGIIPYTKVGNRVFHNKMDVINALSKKKNT